MKTVYLIREPLGTSDVQTLGKMFCGEREWCTLEKAWVQNKRRVSCIPEGEYTVTYLPRSASGKYQKVYHVRDVPNRGGILIHQGNLTSHSLGCILIGMSHGTLNGERAVLSSRVGLTNFRTYMGTDDFKLVVRYVGRIG